MPQHPVPIDPALRPWVRRIAIDADDAEPAAPGAEYRVLPGPYPVLGFQYQGRLDVLRGLHAEPLEPSGLTGLQSSARRYLPRAGARSILVELYPHAAFALFGGAAPEVSDLHVGLSGLVPGPSSRELESRLAETRTLEQRAALVQAFLLTALERSVQRPHPLVAEAARRILQHHGTERIAGLAQALGVADRHLERLFRSQVGVSPKRLAALAQFDWARARLAGGAGAAPAGGSRARLAVDAGYADQAHFIRGFRAFSGITPGQYQADPSHLPVPPDA
jgi:AraC-like DNA-binding protein